MSDFLFFKRDAELYAMNHTKKECAKRVFFILYIHAQIFIIENYIVCKLLIMMLALPKIWPFMHILTKEKKISLQIPGTFMGD